jgi:4'-phosphopantetheinyl transferase
MANRPAVWCRGAAPNDHDAEVWLLGGAFSETSAEKLARELTPAELKRATRFRDPDTRERFILRHAALRMLVAETLTLPPTEVHIDAPAHRAPSISVLGRGPIAASATHTQGLDAVAVSHGGPIGIDVEGIRVIPQQEAVARSLFDAHEMEIFRRLRLDDAQRTLLSAWVLKEAYVKALGTGVESFREVRVLQPCGAGVQIRVGDPGWRSGISRIGRTWLLGFVTTANPPRVRWHSAHQVLAKFSDRRECQTDDAACDRD